MKWTQPAGGLYVWLTFPESIGTGPGSPLMEACLREGVLYVPGEFCHVAPNGRVPSHEIRLCYGIAAPEQIREAIRRLAASREGTARRPADIAKVDRLIRRPASLPLRPVPGNNLPNRGCSGPALG